MQYLRNIAQTNPIPYSESKCHHLLKRNGGDDSPRRSKISSASKKDHFPIKLQHMLLMVEELGLTHIVSWKPHGRAFEVKDVHLFVTFILPRFFKQTKITSFQRQLNLYGFQRMFYGVDAGSSYHQYFLRGKPFLCMAMSRTKVKGVGKRCSRKATDRKGKEPNFYEMKYLPQLETWHRSTIPVGEFPSQQETIENRHSSKRPRSSAAANFPAPSNFCANYGMHRFASSLCQNGGIAVGQENTFRGEACIEGTGQTMQNPRFWHGHTNTHPEYAAPVLQRYTLPFNSHPTYSTTCSTTNEANQYSLSPINKLFQPNFAAPSLDTFPRHDVKGQDFLKDDNSTFDVDEKNESKSSGSEDDILRQHPQSLLSDPHLMCSTKDKNPLHSNQETVAPSLVVPHSRSIQQYDPCEGLDPNRCLTEELKDIFVSLMQED